MVASGSHTHKPGIWKQQNKSHKTGRHRSKGMLDVQNKGRVDVKNLSKHKKKIMEKKDRRNRAQQIRTQKRDEVLNKKRRIGVGNSSPHMVLLLPLHSNVDVPLLSTQLQSCCQLDGSTASFSPLVSAGFTMNIPRFKRRFQIIQPSSGMDAAQRLQDVVDYAKVADTVIFVVSCQTEDVIDGDGEVVLSTLCASGVSSQVFCLQGVNELPAKKRNAVKIDIIKHLKSYVTEVKLQAIDSERDVFNLLRTVGECKRKNLAVWERRPYLLAEKIEYDSGVLQVSGYVRGASLDIQKLVHVVGWGSYQVKQVEQIAEHCAWSAQRCPAGDADRDITEKQVVVEGRTYRAWEKIGDSVTSDPTKLQDLTSEAPVNPLDAEQTWPTDEELMCAEQEEISATKKMKKRVPEGTSEYQAAWILDDNEEDWEDVDDDDEEEDEEEYQPMTDDDESQLGDSQLQDHQSVAEHDSASRCDDSMSQCEDIAVDSEELARFREERSHQLFPDEIDTPSDIAARIRFQKYRGLKSFRTSPWDPMENLPPEYARIFQFQSFDRARKSMKNSQPDEASAVDAGKFVTLHLLDVPDSFVQHHVTTNSPLILFGLHHHEQKMSVLHFALKRSRGCDDVVVKNKDRLVFHVGCRKFSACPVFSQHTLGSKHKMERFLPSDGVVIASVFAPITFPPANVLVFKPGQECGGPVATGTLYSVDPDRIITKRVVLSGHPYRINKRAATIRYMFFQRDDVSWFKPVELRTKYGRRGHIREPIGTHGLMKCSFDAQLISQDTVLLSLYKRVFPKWTFRQSTPLDDDTT